MSFFIRFHAHYYLLARHSWSSLFSLLLFAISSMPFFIAWLMPLFAIAERTLLLHILRIFAYCLLPSLSFHADLLTALCYYFAIIILFAIFMPFISPLFRCSLLAAAPSISFFAFFIFPPVIPLFMFFFRLSTLIFHFIAFAILRDIAIISPFSLSSTLYYYSLIFRFIFITLSSAILPLLLLLFIIFRHYFYHYFHFIFIAYSLFSPLLFHYSFHYFILLLFHTSHISHITHYLHSSLFHYFHAFIMVSCFLSHIIFIFHIHIFCLHISLLSHAIFIITYFHCLSMNAFIIVYYWYFLLLILLFHITYSSLYFSLFLLLLFLRFSYSFSVFAFRCLRRLFSSFSPLPLLFSLLIFLSSYYVCFCYYIIFLIFV